MYNIYEDEKCPVCHARFFEDDDIVFCPECGTPHHRSCWDALGHCVNSEKHSEGFTWTPEKQNNAGENKPVCPNCGHEINPDDYVCKNCNTVLKNASFNQNSFGQPPRPAAGQVFPGGNQGYRNPYMPFSINYGGVDPNDDIDGVTAKDAASFIRFKIDRYLPVFKRFSFTQKNVSGRLGWNWASFLIPEYWFFYRKCNFAGAFATIINLAASILFYPAFTTFNEIYAKAAADTTVTYSGTLDVIRQNIGEFSGTSLTFFGIGLGVFILLRIICGIFGDYIYKNSTIDRIKKVKSPDFESRYNSFDETAAHMGGVNIFTPVLAYFICEVVLQMIVMFMY